MARQGKENVQTQNINKLLLQSVKNHQNPTEYLGPKNKYLVEEHGEYLQKRQEFLNQAKQYKKKNIMFLNSRLHGDFIGYEPSEEFERGVLEERESDKRKFEMTLSNGMSFKDGHKTKVALFRRIRILNELSTGQRCNNEFTENFIFGNQTWFSRYCILSRFIQAARTVIIKRRLERILNVLNKLTALEVWNIERELYGEETLEERKEEEKIEICWEATPFNFFC